MTTAVATTPVASAVTPTIERNPISNACASVGASDQKFDESHEQQCLANSRGCSDDAKPAV
ncbi:hypothetical protein LTR28_005456 [Elasticomyces elasticus]|nr:hypothetical protein LTR28_005456 [Elasticomyces elasticus]